MDLDFLELIAIDREILKNIDIDKEILQNIESIKYQVDLNLACWTLTGLITTVIFGDI